MAAVPLSTPFEKRLLQNGDKFLQELSKQTESKYRTCCLLANSSKCPGEFMIIAHKLLESLKLKFSTEEETIVIDALNQLKCDIDLSSLLGPVSSITDSVVYIKLNRPIIFKETIIDTLRYLAASCASFITDADVIVCPHFDTKKSSLKVSMETGRLLMAAKLLSKLFNTMPCLLTERKLIDSSPLLSSLLSPFESRVYSSEGLRREEFLKNLRPWYEEPSSSIKVIAELFLKEKSLYGRNKFSRNINKIEVETSEASLTGAGHLGLRIYQTIVEKNKQQTKLVIPTTQGLAYLTQQAAVLALMAASSKKIDITTSLSILEVSHITYVNGDACDLESYVQSRYQCTKDASEIKEFEVESISSKMADAAVKFEVLSTPLKNPLKLVLPTQASEFSVYLEGTFVMYNYARMATLERNYRDSISKGVYPAQPQPQDIDYFLLNDEDEWELLYSYILLYPSMLRDATKLTGSIIATNTMNKLPQFLIKLCHLFSSYYSRVKILLPPEPHLFPLIHARMTLVIALKQVLFNGLQILGISPLEKL
ncbi:PREDICTED: uncharacterized protein LOC109584255 isoform X1 [Amphimedon queenslandica]|uniref:DALR anticodon binding domain-containing protein n=1 Tax=Amphimedon queenslandica TaxID=400682 RepID=A0AAN0JEQ0_AMPQE|nr:PREDICTED: uncharacterized protein LOC109584255 isoform X1 [Amphimedon queenslandica]|eukprot:XP_019855500.1 PREDICTED: uncharacterized protein LOC109584255 isoform X1 [Amphimedon queenslandica]